MIPEEAKQTFRIHGGNLHQMHVNQRESLLSSKHILHERGVKKMITQVSNTSLMFIMNYGGDKDVVDGLNNNSSRFPYKRNSIVK